MNSAIDPDNLKELSLALRQGKLPLQDYIIQTLSYIEKTEPVLGALLPEDNRQERLLKQAEKTVICVSRTGKCVPSFRDFNWG